MRADGGEGQGRSCLVPLTQTLSPTGGEGKEQDTSPQSGSNTFTGPKWLLYPGGWPFEFITPTADKTKVVKGGLAALCLGDDVVYSYWLAGIGFCCLTICATLVICFHQLTAQFGRQVCAH